MYNISDNFDVKHGALTIDTTLVITSTGSVFIYFKINIAHYNTSIFESWFIKDACDINSWLVPTVCDYALTNTSFNRVI